MIAATRLASLVLAVLSLAALSPTQTTAQTTAPAATQDAASLLAVYRSMRMPPFDSARRGDQPYVQAYSHDRQVFEMKKADLAKSFLDRFPRDSAAAELMEDRWMILADDGHAAAVLAETDAALAGNADPAARADILYACAFALVTNSFDQAAAPIDRFIKAAPADDRGAELLFNIAERAPAKQVEIFRRIAQSYPATQFGKMAAGSIHRADAIGQPFDLAFTDAISGKSISVQKDLKGKVVVIDFWATWCGPCVAEMPKNKEIYAQYKDKGVQFIGVSLDDTEANGGLKALKDFVAQNDIPWPQYYQGNRWQSNFSTQWGIESVPGDKHVKGARGGGRNRRGKGAHRYGLGIGRVALSGRIVTSRRCLRCTTFSAFGRRTRGANRFGRSRSGCVTRRRPSAR